MIKKGILKSFNGTTYLATVQIEGSLSVWLENIPVSRAIPATEMTSGRSVAVLFHDAGNPSDCVVIAVWT
jgi:pyrroline-5-carboxylate reductase